MLAALNRTVSKTFALWVVLFAIAAFFWPAGFVWVKPWINWILGLIMFGMGMTLTPDNFRAILRHPSGVAVGVAAQFLIMPALAWLLAVVLELPPQVAAGVILVGCCPGGTASNVITYMARGNTALSVACTTVSTLLAPLLTPAIFYVLASKWLEIDAGKMFLSVLQIVFAPLALGLLARMALKQRTEHITAAMPLVSVAGIVLLVSAVVALSRDQLHQSGALILAVVALHNGLGYLLGFWAASFFTPAVTDRRTIAIEVGMQNSGLGVALAVQYFEPIAAVPGAIFSLWHNITGPLLATLWSRRDGQKT